MTSFEASAISLQSGALEISVRVNLDPSNAIPCHWHICCRRVKTVSSQDSLHLADHLRGQTRELLELLQSVAGSLQNRLIIAPPANGEFEVCHTAPGD